MHCWWVMLEIIVGSAFLSGCAYRLGVFMLSTAVGASDLLGWVCLGCGERRWVRMGIVYKLQWVGCRQLALQASDPAVRRRTVGARHCSLQRSQQHNILKVENKLRGCWWRLPDRSVTSLLSQRTDCRMGGPAALKLKQSKCWRCSLLILKEG